MGVNSLPRAVNRQRRDCDLNPGPSALESSTLTTPLPSHHNAHCIDESLFVRHGVDDATRSNSSENNASRP